MREDEVECSSTCMLLHTGDIDRAIPSGLCQQCQLKGSTPGPFFLLSQAVAGKPFPLSWFSHHLGGDIMAF